MNLKHTIIAATLMLVTSTCLAYINKSDDQPLKKSLSGFPMQIGQWQGITDRFDDQVYKLLGVDDSILANYRDGKGDGIQLYIGYYQSQRKGDIIHSPRNCMLDSGWTIIEMSSLALDIKNKKGEHQKVIKLILQNGIQRQVAFYWFYSRGRVITSEYAQKIYLVWDSITKHRTDGSFVRLLCPVTEKGEMQATENLKRFAERIFPILGEFIPD